MLINFLLNQFLNFALDFVENTLLHFFEHFHVLQLFGQHFVFVGQNIPVGNLSGEKISGEVLLGFTD